MEFLTGTLADAVKLAASRALLAREKRATSVEQARAAEDGRTTLGLLGHPEANVNDLARRYRSGEISRTGAMARFHAARPSAVRKLLDTPASVEEAADQGNLSGAAAQADVLGLKGLNPFSSPLTAGAALAGAAGGAHLGQLSQDRADATKLLRNEFKDDVLAKGLTEGQKLTLDAHRGSLPAETSAAGAVRKGYSTGGLRGAAGEALTAAKGLGASPSGLPATTGGEAIGKETMTAAVRRARSSGLGGGRLRPLAGAAGLAAVPLLASEWLSPAGYRSGSNPFSKVLDANAPAKS